MGWDHTRIAQLTTSSLAHRNLAGLEFNQLITPSMLTAARRV